MRYLHYFAAVMAIVLATSCINSDIDDTPIFSSGSNGQLQVVGRVTQYTDCDVATRSKKEGDEPKVTSMGLALFPIDDNGTIGDCLYYDFKLGGSIVFIVDRHDAVFDNYVGKKFAMYIFANMQDAVGFPITAEAGKGKSLEEFTEYAAAASANVEEVPANGFPMVGSLGNTVTTIDDGIAPDGKTLILKPAQTDANVDGLPLVNDVPTDNLEIPLKSMYAKFTFTISVKPDQEIVGNKAPRFDLLNYEVHNIPKTVDSNSSTNDDSDSGVIASSGEVGMGIYAQGATTATFDFYLPERYLAPSKALEEALPAELKNASTEEIEKYRQRYKNKLVDGKAATYVTITGKYTDHQENAHDVSYNIYLGGNNYNDFNIIRNTHYDNSVTIRGISASDDQSVEDGISIDWRVNVERSTPLVINLRRESLLDAHYEVRPLRLRLVGDLSDKPTSATVQILNQNGTANDIPGWIRLEASDNSINHITDAGSLSYGKRKYFTTDLVTNTLAAKTSITVNNLSGANQTVWIYVDENTTTTSRAAIVRVSYDGVDKDFEIVQHGLFEVTSTDDKRTYYIEQYEEYLYNYDAEDSYGQTKQEGMPWGLNGVQLSHIYDSFTCGETNDDWTSFITKNPIKYDFYIRKHDDDNENSDEKTKDGGTLHNYAGLTFTKEIAENSNAGLTKLTLAQTANSAVEYCYNRNKRDANGNVVNVEWYLPSADELEDFIVPAYSTFEEFQDNYYWTSQPAYIRNAFYYEYHNGSRNSAAEDTYKFVVYEDNKTHARATKVVYNNGKYDYVPSGLNKEPKETHNMDAGCINQNEIDKENYFNVMYAWYRWEDSFLWWSEVGTEEKIGDNAIKVDDHFGERIDGIATGNRYHIHLGHLNDLIQETEDGEHGYHERTRNNRVRCVRKMAD
ncbi:MAG: DUF4906 domain-containing protein [Alistipes sp.]|nr:DUF4906 domain-containing protein [Alistipes sp.]